MIAQKECAKILKLIILLSIMFQCSIDAQASERISFPSGNITINAVLFHPSGKGPFPAVVALHGCAGFDGKFGNPNPRDVDWAERLSKQGFIVLLPDSFGSRGVGAQCGLKNPQVRPDVERRADALAAKNYLQTRSDVKPDAISLIGWSNGGSTVLYTIVGKLSNDGHPDFVKAVAFYPNCRQLAQNNSYIPRIPLLLLIGDSDKAMSVPACKAIVQEAKTAQKQANMIVYSRAGHSFDQPNLPGTTNPTARADVLQRVPIFLAH